MENPPFTKVPNGKVCYFQIPSRDIAESASFYHKVFGWNIRTRGDGTTAFDDVPYGISGTWLLGREPHRDPGLLIYIMVDDVAAVLDSVLENGGSIVEPMSGEAPEFIASFSDPSGNVFGVAQE